MAVVCVPGGMKPSVLSVAFAPSLAAGPLPASAFAFPEEGLESTAQVGGGQRRPLGLMVKSVVRVVKPRAAKQR